MDRLDCLRAFVKVMEGGSFSSAARDLGLGQPAVSKRIAVLEREFGTQLFMRNTRKLTPTREAHRIYDLARQALSCIETARASVVNAPAGPTGTLRLGVPTSFGRHYIMPVIEQYLRAYPDVKVDVRFSERNVDLVEDGIELALRIGRLESSSLKARRIGTVRRFLVATPTYLRRHPLPQLPGDLKNLSCIGYARLSPAGQWAFESELGRHVVEIAGSLVVDDADAMKQAVLQHLASPSCRRGAPPRRSGAATWRSCCRNLPCRRCRCTPSIPTPNGCRCAPAVSSIWWWPRPTCSPRTRRGCPPDRQGRETCRCIYPAWLPFGRRTSSWPPMSHVFGAIGRRRMLEMYFMLQIARSPLQAMARRLMCTGLSLATHGKRQCRSCPSAREIEPEA